MRHPAEFCSKCGGEKDAEGWCANYYLADDSLDDDSVVMAADDTGGKEEEP